MSADMPREARATRVSPARLAAYEALFAIEKRDAFAQDVIAKTIDESKLSVQDKAFATRLVLGVVSTKGALDLMLDKCLKSPKDVKANVRCALRIPIYEMIYLDKQTHAAVDQGVELIGYIAPKARGLANFVLRKIAQVKPSFPFGDPDADIDVLALKEGFPAWLAAFFVSTFKWDRAREFMAAANEPAPIYIALNSLKTDEANFLAQADKAGILLKRTRIDGYEVDGCFELADRKAAASRFILSGIEAGKICISDAAAQLVANITVKVAVASFAHANSVERTDSSLQHCAEQLSMLELCAGRATKTILLQSDADRLFGTQILDFTSLDNAGFKVKLLAERAKQYGIHIKDAICADATKLASLFPNRTFDCVFLDAPCTGLGTLRRHPEIRWRIEPSSITDSASLDSMLLTSAASVVADGGILVYATCTVTPQENEQAVLSFLKTDLGRHFKIVPIGSILDNGVGDNASRGQLPYLRTFTTEGSPDSHFCCVLKRLSD